MLMNKKEWSLDVFSRAFKIIEIHGDLAKCLWME